MNLTALNLCPFACSHLWYNWLCKVFFPSSFFFFVWCLFFISSVSQEAFSTPGYENDFTRFLLLLSLLAKLKCPNDVQNDELEEACPFLHVTQENVRGMFFCHSKCSFSDAHRGKSGIALGLKWRYDTNMIFRDYAVQHLFSLHWHLAVIPVSFSTQG